VFLERKKLFLDPMNNSIKLKGPNGKRFSQRTPDLGCMIGRNTSSSIDRGMRGLSQVRAM